MTLVKNAKKDLTGHRFGRWLVESATPRRSASGRSLWMCVCDCGTRKELVGISLLAGGTNSCGCLKKEPRGPRGPYKKTGHDANNLTGKVFGKLTVLAREGTYRNKWPTWRCRCECGKETVVRASVLVQGDTLSCGCAIKKAAKLKREKWPPGEAGFRGLLCAYKKSASSRGYSWDLSDEDFRRLTSSNCDYCGSPPMSIRKAQSEDTYGDYVYNGIDRVDNREGYSIESVKSCCHYCNRAKIDRPLEEFVAYLDRVAAFRNKP